MLRKPRGGVCVCVCVLHLFVIVIVSRWGGGRGAGWGDAVGMNPNEIFYGPVVLLIVPLVLSLLTPNLADNLPGPASCFFRFL